MITLPIENAPEKPEEGSPCNGCGWCCASSRCDIAVLAIGEGPGPCPLLKFYGGRHWCTVVAGEIKAKTEPLVSQILGIGVGCYTNNYEEVTLPLEEDLPSTS